MAKAKGKKKDVVQTAIKAEDREVSTESDAQFIEARDALLHAMAPGLTVDAVNRLVWAFEESVRMNAAEAEREDQDQVACPTFTIRADHPFGMKLMVALSHWAQGSHEVDMDGKRGFRGTVREFELWREANQ